MSYILSALKKADQERHSGDAPGVLTSQAVRESAEEKRGSYPVIAVTIALLLGAVLVGLLRPGGVAVDDSPGDASLAGHGAPSAESPDESLAGRSKMPPFPRVVPRAVPEARPPGAAPEVASAPVLTPTRPPSRGLAGDEDVFAAPPTVRGSAEAVEQWTPVGGIPDLAELPPSLRGHLPRLRLTGHLYSLGHPNARKVILNGVALKEKQYLEDELMVSEITPDGVILDFRGQLFHMGAAQMFR